MLAPANSTKEQDIPTALPVNSVRDPLQWKPAHVPRQALLPVSRRLDLPVHSLRADSVLSHIGAMAGYVKLQRDAEVHSRGHSPRCPFMCVYGIPLLDFDRRFRRRLEDAIPTKLIVFFATTAHNPDRQRGQQASDLKSSPGSINVSLGSCRSL